MIQKKMSADEQSKVALECVLDEAAAIVSIRFYSQKAGHEHRAEHGLCVLGLKQPALPVEHSWSRLQPLIQAQLETLDNALRPKQVHALDRQLFYKVFSEIVDYAPAYHAVEEAILAADFRDATFAIQLPPNDGQWNYTCSPFFVDAAVHVAGFLLNANVNKPKSDVHIANDIGSLRILRMTPPTEPLRAYATVREQDPVTHTSMCDAYVTDAAGELVVICTDTCFKKLDRDFFALLTGSDRVTARKPLPAQKPKLLRGVSVLATPTSSTEQSSSSSSPLESSPALSSQSDSADLASQLLSTIVACSDISMTDLESNSKATFADIGVASQMSIQILADFQKTTAVELPAAFFTNFFTPAHVKDKLGSHNLDNIQPLVPTRRAKSKAFSALKSESQSRKTSSNPKLLSKQLFDIIADALGVDVSTFTGSIIFESLGLDSMLSIKTLSTFHQQTGLELPAAFFNQFATVAAARKELDGTPEALPQTPADEPDTLSKKPRTPPTAAPVPAKEQKIESAVSRAVLVQGSARSKSAPLFMTTDGSGTVESYIHLAALPEGRRIYALESPFLLESEKFDLTIEEMARIFVRAIRPIQPNGPYLIGGWSAGSVYAYEVAHSLTRAGEDILALIVLDMRAPSPIPREIVTTDFVEQLGTFEGINRARDLPEDLSVEEKAHLMATCRALSRYKAPPFAAAKRPRYTAVVWARLGSFGLGQPRRCTTGLYASAWIGDWEAARGDGL
jgi:iterative type I PKS product template protein